jgi:hypothetical protein
VCAELVAALPEEIDPGVERRPVTGDAERTAAWGEPPVTLQCGVEPPERLGSPVVVNDVAWTVDDIGPGFRWTTSDRAVLVAVETPDAYDNPVELIFPLSPAVARTVPASEEEPS